MATDTITQAPTPAEAERPEWIDSTPVDVIYHLCMFNSLDVPCEEIHLTREQYIALKVRAAELMGFEVGRDVRKEFEQTDYA